MATNDGNNEILFWKVYHNQYIRNEIFQQIKIGSHTNINEMYLGSRVPFSLIRSLKFISKRNMWSILYDKLSINATDYGNLVINKKGIIQFLKNCKKDKQLIELLYLKHTDEMNQVDLITTSIQTNNLIALELFTKVYKIQTNFQYSIDAAHQFGMVNVLEMDYFKDEVKNKQFSNSYTSNLFKTIKENKYIIFKYILSNHVKYSLSNDMIDVGTFLSFDEKTRMLVMDFQTYNLLKIEDDILLIKIRRHFASKVEIQSDIPTILPNSIYQLLNHLNPEYVLSLTSTDILFERFLLTAIVNLSKDNNNDQLKLVSSCSEFESLKYILQFLPNENKQIIIDYFNLQGKQFQPSPSKNQDVEENDEGGINQFSNTIKKFNEILNFNQQLSKPFIKPIEQFQFNGYRYRNNLNEIIKRGDIKEFIKYLNLGYGNDYLIGEPLSLKILKYIDTDTIKQISHKLYWFGPFQVPRDQIIKLFLKVIKLGRSDLYLYFIDKLPNFKFKLLFGEVLNLTVNCDIEMIKFLFQLDLNLNGTKGKESIEASRYRNHILKCSFTDSIKHSNIKLCKWFQSTDNIFLNYLNLSTIDSLDKIEYNLKISNVQYISIPSFKNYYDLYMK